MRGMTSLRSSLIRLAHEQPDLFPHLLPLLGVRTVMAGNYVEFTEANGMVYVSGPYHLMSESVNPRLKSQGFRWDGGARRWEISAAKLTPLKRRNLMKLIEPLTAAGAASAGTDLRSPKQKIEDEMLRRRTEGLCLDLPYDLGEKAKSLGGLWDTTRRVWCMPDKESLDTLREAVDRTPKMVALREIARRKTERLGVNIPYEYKDEAKSLGGLWDPDTRTWYMPDSATQRKILDKVESDKEQARQVALRHLEQERERVEAERKRLGLKTYYFPGDSRADHPSVGHTFRDRKTGDFMVVTDVKSVFYREDGLSFGLPDDTGWLHTVTAKPSEDETAIQGIKDREQQELTVSQARTRRRELVKMVHDRGDFPTTETDLRREEPLVLSGRRSLPYGGGNWFVVTPSHVWHVQNNGGDGDDWGTNNVVTGGAGAMGWRVPRTDELVSELSQLDALIGER